MENDLLLKALHGEALKRPPVWLMRQAGRYMASYRAFREKYDFLTICYTPELIVAVTELPIKQFGFDAAIIFSDILLLLKAFGVDVAFIEGQGPVISGTVEQIMECRRRDDMDYLVLAIRELKKRLQVPLIGFAGAPFTLMSYLVDGKSAHLRKTKQLMWQEPERFCALMDMLTEQVIWLLNRQIEAGVDVVQIFDSWAHLLPAKEFEQFCVGYIKKILARLKPCHTIVFCKGARLVDAAIGSTALSFDWQTDLAAVRKRLPISTCVQGNLDPELLLADRVVTQRATKELLESMREQRGFIFNLGHGILPQTPEENVHALVECVRHGVS